MTTLSAIPPRTHIASGPRILRVVADAPPLRSPSSKCSPSPSAASRSCSIKPAAALRILRKLGPDRAPRIAGLNTRYDAIVVLGAMYLPPEQQTQVFCGDSALEFCGKLIDDCQTHEDLGAVALVAWAAAEVGHPSAGKAFERSKKCGATTANIS